MLGNWSLNDYFKEESIELSHRFLTEAFKIPQEKIAVTVFEGADENKVFAFKVIADHMRSAVFVLGDDKAIVPSNVDQGYVLRRIIRRTMRYLKKIGKDEGAMTEIAKVIVDKYSPVYEELKRNEDFIYKELERKERIFNKTIDYGLKIATKTISEMQRGSLLDGHIAFKLYDTFGFPLKFTQELASEYGVGVDVEGFNNCYRKHQEKSRLGD